MADYPSSTPPGVSAPHCRPTVPLRLRFRAALDALERVTALESALLARGAWSAAAAPDLRAQELTFERAEAELRGICAARPGDGADLHLQRAAFLLYRAVTAETASDHLTLSHRLAQHVEAELMEGGGGIAAELHRLRDLLPRCGALLLGDVPVVEGDLPPLP